MKLKTLLYYFPVFSINRIILFCTGFIQVALVAAQTYMIARAAFIGVLIVGFLISLVWSINVKKVAFGGWTDRLIYSSGAGIGAVSGLWISILLTK